jgi:phospholipase C
LLPLSGFGAGAAGLDLLQSSAAAGVQLGPRLPFIAVSPFSKPNYVSHRVGDHTSLLAFIERRFLTINDERLHLTNRDQFAHPLEHLFDFNHSPSLNTPIGQAAPPTTDCTP